MLSPPFSSHFLSPPQPPAAVVLFVVVLFLNTRAKGKANYEYDPILASSENAFVCAEISVITASLCLCDCCFYYVVIFHCFAGLMLGQHRR